MTYRNLTNINITLQDVGVTAQGFGTPLFASEHNFFPERVRAYTSLEAAAEDLTPESSAYKAVQGFFSVTPAPAVVKVGRRETGEDAATLIAALVEEDDDFYFFTCEDHTDTFIQEASADIESRLKMYFVSTEDETVLTPYSAGSATDIGGIIADSGRDRTKLFFHHNADTVFPECIHVASNAPYEAGSVTWMNIQLPVSISQDPTTSKALSVTQRGYLEDRNISYTERSVGTGVVASGSNLRNNLTPSGEWISNIRGRDNLQVDLEAEMLSLLLSQRGTKIPYTNDGIALIKTSVRNVLENYAVRGFINSNYQLDFRPASAMSTSDKRLGLYNGGSFKAELSQGILYIDISGSLTVNLG